MQKKKRNLFYAEEGVMALEACISLTLFLIAMVALYSLINMFTAQSMISHALQQTGQSIALENYKNSKTDVKTLQKLPLSLLQKFTDGIGASSDSKYDVGGGAFSNSMVFTDYLSLSTVKKRFASYLGGNTENADKMLQNMGVVDGLNGIKIKSAKISGNDVVIEISYKVRLIFYIEMFHFGEFESTQKVCCRLWK